MIADRPEPHDSQPGGCKRRDEEGQPPLVEPDEPGEQQRRHRAAQRRAGDNQSLHGALMRNGNPIRAHPGTGGVERSGPGAESETNGDQCRQDAHNGSETRPARERRQAREQGRRQMHQQEREPGATAVERPNSFITCGPAIDMIVRSK